jgi:hypothetical protein
MHIREEEGMKGRKTEKLEEECRREIAQQQDL